MEVERQNLGNQLDFFPIKNLRIKRMVGLSIGTLLILISLAIGILHLIETWKVIEIHGRAILLNRLSLPFLMLGIVLPFGVGIVIFTKHHWNDRINIYEKGLVKQKGNRSETWLWWHTERIDNQVIYVKFAGNAVGVRVNITLDDRKQNRFTLKNHYDQMDELTLQIRQHVLPILYSKARHRLKRGDTIHFNEQLKVDFYGVQIRDHTYPWHELSSPVINNGLLTISATSGQQKVFNSNINQVENLDLLIHLFEHPPGTAN